MTDSSPPEPECPCVSPALDSYRASPRQPSGRLRLSLEIAVPVLVRSDEGLARGLARNISEATMLVELESLPPIGSPVDVTIFGLPGTADSPQSLVLKGEVRHHLTWQYGHDRRGLSVMRGIGIRLASPTGPQELQEAPTSSAPSGTPLH